MSAHGPMPRSAWIFPTLAVLFVATATAFHISFTPTPGGLGFAAVLLVILFGTVFAAVHHAELIAERIGEPYGTLLLTLAVTIIEVALIATIMLGDKPVPTLARDTVFAVIMIVCNGLVGVCILAGGLRYREQDVQVSGSSLYLSVLIVMATITLIMPNYTLTTQGPVYSALQLGFVSVVTVLLYGVFLYTQTVLHRNYFVNQAAGLAEGGADISNRLLGLSVVLLLVSLLSLTFLLLPLLLVSLLLLTFPLLLLLIGLPKHYLRRNRDQGKAKQKHGCLPGLSTCGGNHREKNGLMRQTFRHSCWFGVNDVAFDEGLRKTLRENRSRDTLHNRLGAALHRKVLRNNVNVRSA